MERCCGQAAMVHADHVNLWWGVELLIPLLKHTKYYYFCVKSMCRPIFIVQCDKTNVKEQGWLSSMYLHAHFFILFLQVIHVIIDFFCIQHS